MSCTSKWRIFKRALPRLAADREGLDLDVVQGRAVLQFLLELRGLGPELGIRELAEIRGSKALMASTLGAELLDLALVRGTHDFLESPGQHGLRSALSAVRGAERWFGRGGERNLPAGEAQFRAGDRAPRRTRTRPGPFVRVRRRSPLFSPLRRQRVSAPHLLP